ncbi:annexin-like protein RJ4 [Nicotiana tomentosiformis]|uniref:annexin-like protein RJ4 n=1 Tax=Nicotiana tomentosiformis TaxID=4098 RepID=UPI00051C575F|nr:annexin-like protein RJ4 [Nicotiana tomentosiformis]
MATLICPEDHSPVADAEAIRKACKGWGTDEKALISILGHRTATQRKIIRKTYEEMYNEELVKRLESELSGHFEKAVYRWMLDPEERDAVILNVAIKEKPILDYTSIIELSCIYSPQELLAVKRAYETRYKHSVEEDLALHSTGELRKLLVFLVGIYRYAGDEIDARLAKSEADIMCNAIKSNDFNHEEIVRIITTRSKTQLRATLNRYKDDNGSSLTKYLRDDEAKAANAFLGALRTTIRCIINDPQQYYEKVIRRALMKSGTDEESVTRVIVSRAEKDLEIIKELFYKRNSVTLCHAVSKHTSGDYKSFLVALLGNQN